MEKIYRYILILLSSFTSLSAFTQDTLSAKVNGNITSMSIDAKGNFYVADDNYSLYKYDKTGKLITNVNIKTYGEITSIDCSNPFELYVYYQDQNIIVFYDNMLNIRGELRLNDMFYNVACISRSFDNHIWLIDMTEFKMLKINKKGDILIETPYLNNILQNDIHPFKIWEYNNYVYVADSVKGVYQFDLLGTYVTTFYLSDIEQISYIKEGFFIVKNNQLLGYRMLTREPFKLQGKIESSRGLTHYEGRLYTYFVHKIISYPAR